jgi:peptidoglycan/LPS O-acetylase OafA/YrhL
MTPAVPFAHTKYRADIDGLRAIAVLSVIGFHAFPSAVVGGFIGVDIFFVISGFLISSIILGGLEKGNFSFLEFYARRVKRIFPALLVVLVAVYTLGWVVLFAGEFRQLGKHIVGGAGFVSNLMLWGESGYFDKAANAKPLLHLWSLGIEEQFYIFWPLLLWFASKRHLSLLPLTAVVCAVSFALNIGTVGSDVVAAFYSPLTRTWELMLGAALAYATLHKSWVLVGTGQRHLALRSLSGIVLICAGMLTITTEQAFPGWLALLPTAGAALVISAGPHGWLNRVVLSNRVLVWFGLISYPLYLWHWPVLSFLRIVMVEPPSWGLRVVAVLLAVVLAWLTYSLVEKPIRFGGQGRRKAGIVAGAMVAVLTAGLLASDGVPQPKTHDPIIARIFEDTGEWGASVYPFPYATERFYEISGDKADVTFLFGDSHVWQYAPRVAELLGKSKSGANTAVFASGGGCFPVEGYFNNPYSHLPQCIALRKAALAYIRQYKVKVVVVGGTWNYIQANAPESLDLALNELEALLNQVKKDKTVYLLLDNPTGGAYSPLGNLEGNRFTGIRVKSTTPKATEVPAATVALNNRLIAIAARLGVPVINTLDGLCTDGMCPVRTASGDFVYRDGDHLSVAYVTTGATYLDPVMFSK